MNEHPRTAGEQALQRRWKRLLKALSSLRFTLVLLFCVVVLSLIGTIFPQADRTAVQTPGLWSLLSPYDIFHSIWLMVVGALLCVNLVLCMRYRVRRLNRRKLFMLLLHAGVFLVIVGYSLGCLGLDGFVNIPEGGEISKLRLRSGSWHDLGFSVRCDSFAVDFYENGMPREYVSDLSFIRDNEVVKQARVRVNHPTRFSGVSFYQESYHEYLSADLTVSGGDGIETLRVTEGDVVELASAGTKAHVLKVWHDLMHAGPAVKLLIEDDKGGRLMWVLQNIDEIRSRVPDIFEQMPGFDPSGLKPYTFSCTGVKHAFITGIGVRRDPGTAMAGVGGTLFFLSLLLVFLVPQTGSSSQQQRSRETALPVDSRPVSPGADARETAKGERP